MLTSRHVYCVCYFFYDDKAMGTHITLSQLDVAAPESSYPLGDKPVNQPALSQTLVLSNLYLNFIP